MTAHAARPRLTRYSRALVDAANGFMHNAQIGLVAVAGEGWRVRADGPVVREYAALDVNFRMDGIAGRVLLADLDAIAAIGTIAWTTLDDRMRVLYAEYRAEALLAEFASVWGVSIELDAVTIAASFAPVTGLALVLRAAAHSSPAQARRAHLTVVLEDAGWRRLAHVSRWSTVAALAPPAPIALRLDVTLEPIALPASDLRALQVGDVIRTDQSKPQRGAALPSALRLGTRNVLLAALEPGRLRVTAVLDLPRPLSPGDAMQSPAVTTGLANLDQVELPTTFHLGSVQTTLDTLKTIRAGYVFTTTIDSEAPCVTIMVDGQRLGAGRLVAVGSAIGVQITRWLPTDLAVTEAGAAPHGE